MPAKVLLDREKHAAAKSSYAVPGCTSTTTRWCRFAREIAPSARGELEITAVNDVLPAEAS